MGAEWRELGRGDTMAAAREDAQAALRVEGQEVPDEEIRVRADTENGERGFRSFVRVAPEKTMVERLTLISELEWLHFEPAVLLEPGEVFWTWGRTMHVRGSNGEVRQVQARPPRPNDPR